MKAPYVLLLLGACALVAFGARSLLSRASKATIASEHSQAGVDSPEQLKDRLLQAHQKNDPQAMLGLFYLKGASDRMVNLYRDGLPEAKLTIESATIEEISEERQTKIVHTLTPEKVLLLKFSKANQREPAALEQFFYIGREAGKYYFTLPAGG